MNSLRQWISDTEEMTGEPAGFEPTEAGLIAAGQVLDTDPEQGAGRPELIRRAAIAAEWQRDAPLAAWLVKQAEGWEHYLGALAWNMAVGCSGFCSGCGKPTPVCRCSMSRDDPG